MGLLPCTRVETLRSITNLPSQHRRRGLIDSIMDCQVTKRATASCLFYQLLLRIPKRGYHLSDTGCSKTAFGWGSRSQLGRRHIRDGYGVLEPVFEHFCTVLSSLQYQFDRYSSRDEDGICPITYIIWRARLAHLHTTDPGSKMIGLLIW